MDASPDQAGLECREVVQRFQTCYSSALARVDRNESETLTSERRPDDRPRTRTGVQKRRRFEMLSFLELLHDLAGGQPTGTRRSAVSDPVRAARIKTNISTFPSFPRHLYEGDQTRFGGMFLPDGRISILFD